MKRSYLLILVIKLILAATCIGALARGIYTGLAGREFVVSYFVTAFTALLALGLTFIPNFMRHKDIMLIPAALQTFFTVFIFLAMFFGEILHFFDRFSWWDSMLHLSSGIMFGIIGYMLFISLNRDNSVRKKMNPVSVILFVLCFSVACGALWEIFEFSADCLLGTNSQRWLNDYTPEQWAALQNISNASNPGLLNTMKDLICCTIGTLFSIVIIVPLVKRDNSYVKTNITSKDLLDEGIAAIAET